MQDLSLADTDPSLTPYIKSCNKNQTVREAYPVPTWIASLPASMQDYVTAYPVGEELRRIREDAFMEE